MGTFSPAACLSKRFVKKRNNVPLFRNIVPLYGVLHNPQVFMIYTLVAKMAVFRRKHLWPIVNARSYPVSFSESGKNVRLRTV